MKIKFKNGFTLIELLVVLAIIGILSAVIFVNMARVGTTTDLKNAGRQLAAAISNTRNYALTGKTKTIDGSNGKDFYYPCSFKFETQSDNSYKISYLPRKINQECADSSDYEIFEGPFKLNKIDSLTAKTIFFSVPHGIYSSSPVDKDKVDFILEEKGRQYKVTVHSSGLIEESDVVN